MPWPGKRAYRPHITKYVNEPNRLLLGERTVLVMSPKVGQKSYGNEKRFVSVVRIRVVPTGTSTKLLSPAVGSCALLLPHSSLVAVGGRIPE